MTALTLACTCIFSNTYTHMQLKQHDYIISPMRDEYASNIKNDFVVDLFQMQLIACE